VLRATASMELYSRSLSCEFEEWRQERDIVPGFVIYLFVVIDQYLEGHRALEIVMQKVPCLEIELVQDYVHSLYLLIP
jgi:hypothetical protein